MSAPTPLDRVRELCLALPETSERLSHGSPTFFIRDKKTFVMYLGAKPIVGLSANPRVAEAEPVARPQAETGAPRIGRIRACRLL